MDTRLDCLIQFTRGNPVEIGDHRWVPVAHGVVAHFYRGREPVEKDIVDAAKEAGPIIDWHVHWGQNG